MSQTAWFVASLGSALELGIATPDDVLRHVTADVLAQHLPRPLWARLLTASLGAGRLDAALVVDTLGVANLCEHAPRTLLWQVLAEVAARSLGGAIPAARAPGPALLAPAPAPAPVAVAASSPALLAPVPAASSPAIPAPSSPAAADPHEPEAVASGAASTSASIARPRTTSQRFRPSNTGLTRATPPSAPPGGAASSSSASSSSSPSSPSSPASSSATGAQPRRPQAAAPAEAPRSRRVPTEVSDYDIATDVRTEGDWRTAQGPSVDVDVDDEQLVDWAAASEETISGERKR